ncbi:MAG: GNAT family N-acetyltransferase, partial [Bradyrhizobium sp.]|nr:GNAT family N-acetyltransferase [Bradyrhizobium sp.]
FLSPPFRSISSRTACVRQWRLRSKRCNPLSISISADRRSRGIGELLLRWAIDEARGRGCNLVELMTHQSRTDAQRFYERLGFAKSHFGMVMRF